MSDLSDFLQAGVETFLWALGLLALSIGGYVLWSTILGH